MGGNIVLKIMGNHNLVFKYCNCFNLVATKLTFTSFYFLLFIITLLKSSWLEHYWTYLRAIHFLRLWRLLYSMESFIMDHMLLLYSRLCTKQRLNNSQNQIQHVIDIWLLAYHPLFFPLNLYLHKKVSEHVSAPYGLIKYVGVNNPLFGVRRRRDQIWFDSFFFFFFF